MRWDMFLEKIFLFGFAQFLCHSLTENGIANEEKREKPALSKLLGVYRLYLE